MRKKKKGKTPKPQSKSQAKRLSVQTGKWLVWSGGYLTNHLASLENEKVKE